MVIASEDHRTCPRLKIAPRAISTAGFGSEDRQLRFRSPLAVSIPRATRKGPFRPVGFQGVPSDPGAIWSYFIGCGRVDYTFLSQQRTFSAPLTNSANFFRA
jgi:hypothetical protein